MSTNQPLTADSLSALLDILGNPEHPAFPQAVERLTTLDPSTLNPSTATSLLARLQTLIEKLAAESTLTSTQLNALRNRGQALQSYNSNR